MMKRHMRLIAVALIVFTGLSVSVGEGKQAEEQLKITGKVVAYDPSTSLISLTSAPKLEILVVRIEERVKGREESRYVKVLYKHMENNPTLPERVFDGKSLWSFALRREPSCDGPMKALPSLRSHTGDGSDMPLPRLKRTLGAESEKITDETNLPCYSLRSSDLRPVTN